MALKFDKESLKKHHFWLLFLPFAVALVVAWVGLFTDVPDAVSSTQEKYEGDRKKLSKINAQPRAMVGAYSDQVTKLDAQRVSMWKEGWGEQKDIFVWPAGYTSKQLDIVKNLKFGDDVPEKIEFGSVRSQFSGSDTIYKAEYNKLIALLEPMQFRESWDKVLRYKSDWGPIPSHEDMWLAMEDLWVQRELLLAIHRVNVEAAHLKPVLLAKSANDDPKHRRFENRTWDIDLQIVESKNKRILKGTLKNKSKRLQVLGNGNVMQLKVWLSPDSKAPPFMFEIQGGTLDDPIKKEKKDVGGTLEADWQIEIKSLPKHTIPDDWKVTEISRVEQQYDIRTVPVKRIEYVSLGRLSDRNNNLPLKMATFSENLAKKEPPAASGSGRPVGPAMDSQPTAETTTLNPFSQNKLERSRYIDVTEQVRRMPVGLVVTTDQSYVKDILESLVNIKLRFQITQVHWNRFHGTLEYGPAPGGTATPVGPAGFDGPFGRPGFQAPSTNREDQFSANLMEINIYGLLSLYERFPEPIYKEPPTKKDPRPNVKKDRKTDGKTEPKTDVKSEPKTDVKTEPAPMKKP